VGPDGLRRGGILVCAPPARFGQILILEVLAALD